MPMSKIYSSIRCFAVIILAGCSVVSYGQSLACNGGVNISMDNNCEVVMDARHILKGEAQNPDPIGYLLSVKNLDGSTPTDILVYDLANSEFSDTIGSQGEYLKFLHPGAYTVTIQRKSDGVRCWSDLLVEDKLLPFTEDCPCASTDLVPDEDCIFSCASINQVLDSQTLTGQAGVNPVFKDNCGNTGSVTFQDVLRQDTSCGGWIITRTWRSLVPDANGTMVNKDLKCVQRFIFKNIGVSAIMPPSNKVVVTCGIDTDPQSLRNYFSDTTYFNNPNKDTALVRSYPSLVDTLPGGSLVLSKIGEGLSGNTNDAYCKLTASFTDSPTIPFCGDIGYKFVRTWHVIDWCTNETLPPLTQIIKVMDNEAPTFMLNDTIAISSTDPWSCDVDIIAVSPDSLMDNCSAANQLTWKAYVLVSGTRIEANATNGYQLSGIGTGQYVVNYEVTDLCGNTATDSAVLIIKDMIKPVALSKRRVKVTFSSFQGECVAKVFTRHIDANSFDACDDEVDLSIRRFESGDAFGPFVKFHGDDLTDVTAAGVPFGEVVVELKVEDDSGNFNLGWTTVVLEDKATDVTTVCGDTSVSVSCTAVLDSVIADYLPTVTLNGCSDRALPVGYQVRSNTISSSCNTGEVEVDYFIEGSANIICTKVFNFGDSDRLSIQFPTADITVGCEDTDFGDVIITGGNCNNALPTEKITEFDVPAGLGYCKKILREITVIDWCNYTPNTGDTTGIYRFVQTIKVDDNSNPIIECQSQEVSAGASCGVAGIIVTASGTDLGSCSEALSWEASVDTDGDGNYDLDLDVTSASGDDVSATITASLAVGTHNVRWRALDGCGNGDEVVCTVKVIDNIAPAPQCVTIVSTATMNTDGSVTIWAADFDPNNSSLDNCGGPLTYSFSGEDRSATNRTFSCSDIADGISAIIDMRLYVWDASGNNDFCNVQLRIDDNNSNACPDSSSINMGASSLISGMIISSNGDRLESAMVTNTSMTTQAIHDQATNVDGQYAFADNAMMSDYEITVEKSDDYLNGVSTLDLVLIQRHILGYSRFESPYKMIAADVNSDTRISAIDLVQLRNLILGRTTTFPSGQSWKFIDASQQLENGVAPWPLTEKLYVPQLQSEMLNQDFIGIKIGDVNGTAIANSTLVGYGRSANRLVLNVPNKEVRKGDIHQLTLDLSGINDIYGVQLNLLLNKGQWLDVKSNDISLSDEMMSINNDQLLLSWATAEGVDGEQTFTFIFKALADGILSDFVNIDASGLSSEVYMGSSLERHQLDINYQEVADVDFTLHQNVPNPFDGNTTISFSIGKPGAVELSIFDVTGRQLMSQSEIYDAGTHSVDIDENLVEQKGILYYQISFDNKVATKKMISIE